MIDFIEKRVRVISWLIYAGFFVSGLTALIYEILWEKKLELSLGTSAEGLTTILSTFFIGIAIGSLLFGNLAEKVKVSKLLLIYGFIEIAIGGLASLTPLIFSNPNQMSFLYLVLPTTLMGGTFPIVTKILATPQNLKDKVSLLYGLNTLGGIFGIILSSYLLIRLLGINGSLYLAAMINVLIGISLIALSLTNQLYLEFIKVLKEKPEKDSSKPNNLAYHLFLLCFFLTGFLSLALQILWTKTLSLVFGATFYSFSIILIIFLLGLALGGLTAKSLNPNRARFWFGLALALVAIWILLSLPLFNNLPQLFIKLLLASPNFFWGQISIFIISSLIIFPATYLFGVSFPLAVQLYKSNSTDIGQNIGRVYFANTFGAVLGPLAVYFFALDQLGIQRSIILVALIYGLLALLFLKKSKLLVIFLSLSISSLIFVNFKWFGWDRAELTQGRYINRLGYFPGTKMLYYKEGKNMVVSVREGVNQGLSLQLNGKTDASTIADLDTELLFSHIPLIFSPQSKKTFMIGLGSGISSGAISTYPVDQIDIAEIEDAVLEAEEFFKTHNQHILADKRVRLIRDDARSYLTHTNNQYDLILSQPSNLWMSGVSNLFTKEFYQLAANHLSDRGIMVQWIQNYNISQENLKIAIRTFASVFPNFTIWADYKGLNIFLISSSTNTDNLKINDDLPPSLPPQLLRIGIDHPSELFDFYISSHQNIIEKIGQGKINTDNFPWLEINTPSDIYLANGSNIDFLDSFLQKHPNQPTDSFEVRKLLLETQQLTATADPKVDDLFTKLISLRPENGYIKRMYVDFLAVEADKAIDTKDYERAKQLLNKSTDYSKDNFVILNLWGKFYLSKQDLDQAIQNLQRSIQLSNDYAESHLLLGTAFDIKRDWIASERELKAALTIEPKNYGALNTLTNVYLNQGKKDQATQALAKSLSINPNQPELEVLYQSLIR